MGFLVASYFRLKHSEEKKVRTRSTLTRCCQIKPTTP